MVSLKKRILVDKICSNPLRTAKEWIISKEFVDLEAISVQINIIFKKPSKVVNFLFFSHCNQTLYSNDTKIMYSSNNGHFHTIK